MPAISDYQEETMLSIFDRRMQAINDRYLQMIGKNVKNVLDALNAGNISASLSDVNSQRLIAMKQIGADTKEIQAEIAKELNISMADVDLVLDNTAAAEYTFYEKYYKSAKKTQIPFKDNKKLQDILKAQAKITNGEMINLSRTTVVSDLYKNVIDEAIQAVQTGVGDYGTELRLAMKKAASEGLRVKYASGHTRRLDSAVRMNILDGVRRINQEVAIQTGEEYGADGYELSAHISCAEDHLPYQGKQYTKKQFEQLNDSLYRKIGTWNCRHFAFPILVGISEPAYSKQELKDLNDYSSEQIEIDGKTKTRYEWTQVQRRMETEVRRQKDTWNLANAADDRVLKRECNAKINKIKERYKYISEKAGLPVKKERMSVSGYGKKYVKNEVPKQQIIKALKKPIYADPKDIVKDSKLKPLEVIEHLKKNAEQSGQKFTPSLLSKSGFYDKFGYSHKLNSSQLKKVLNGEATIDDIMASMQEQSKKVVAAAIVDDKVQSANEFIAEFKSGFSKARNRLDAISLFNMQRTKLTGDEIDALAKYTGSYYREINNYLRSGRKYKDKDHDKFTKTMDSAFRKLKTDKAYYSLRKLDKSVFSNLFGDDTSKWVGQIFNDKGYVSSSVSSDGFYGEINLCIRVPKGASAAYVESISSFKSEEELLLNRDSSFRIVAVEEDGGEYEVYLDMLK